MGIITDLGRKKDGKVRRDGIKRIGVGTIAKNMAKEFQFVAYGKKKKLKGKQLRIILSRFIQMIIEEIDNGNIVMLEGFASFLRNEKNVKRVYNFNTSEWKDNVIVSRLSCKASEQLKRRWNNKKGAPQVELLKEIKLNTFTLF